ncbi:MAG: hypothetical protein H0T95_00255 [Chthoniobacterales bacterium]|jgi:hypothetical protein|nr:hypothetical protein [Chthoniobacterales bacterium]MBA3763145.1 hypothetical protein [Chthoniobacterales bacterium]
MLKELWIMDEMEKPEAHGSPSEKARKSLGEKLNRPAKPPPTFPGKKAEKNDPLARRVTDEVDDL